MLEKLSDLQSVPYNLCALCHIAQSNQVMAASSVHGSCTAKPYLRTSKVMHPGSWLAGCRPSHPPFMGGA